MAGRKTAREPIDNVDAVRAYKEVLSRVLDNRPSGTRQRIASALGKNRSFVSQIANAAYATPVPARHIELIFDICHFSLNERQEFLAAYGRAHPMRVSLVHGQHKLRAHTVYLPDLGDARNNARLDALINDFARKIGAIIDELK